MNRAYSTLEIKQTSDANGKRTFTGIASTPATDRMGDIVEPNGAEFKLPIPLLWQHDSAQPIGWVKSAKVTDKGIEVSGEVANITDEGMLKQRLTEAWQMLKTGLVRGLSIGFNPIESADINGSWGQRFLKWEWLELSCVTIPANQDASIITIKSIDTKLRAASGHVQQGVKTTLGGAAPFNQKGSNMKTLQQLREEREQKLARMKELQTNAEANDVELTAEESGEFDTLEIEVKSLDKDIRQARFDYLNSSTAAPVEGKATASASRSRVGIITKTEEDEKFQGQNFTRMIIARAIAFDEMMRGRSSIPAFEIAEKRWGRINKNLAMILKTNIPGGDSLSGAWGAELVGADNRYTGDFITFLTSRTVYDKLGLRDVPANVAIKGQDGAATGYWVGHQRSIPVSKPDFSTVSLAPMKVGAIAAISNELLRDASPSAEMLVRDSLVDASAQRVDTTFLSASAAVSNVSPAGILNGLTAGTSAGVDAAGVLADIKALYRPFITAKNASGLKMVMAPSQAKALSLLLTTLGGLQFPGVTADGGTLMGDTLVTGENVGGGDFILLKPSDIWRIGDVGLDVELSREATLEMTDTPLGEGATPTTAATAMVSMFQANMTAIKVVRNVNFQLRRSTAVSYIRNVDYDGVSS